MFPTCPPRNGFPAVPGRVFLCRARSLCYTENWMQKRETREGMCHETRVGKFPALDLYHHRPVLGRVGDSGALGGADPCPPGGSSAASAGGLWPHGGRAVGVLPRRGKAPAGAPACLCPPSRHLVGGAAVLPGGGGGHCPVLSAVQPPDTPVPGTGGLPPGGADLRRQ